MEIPTGNDETEGLRVIIAENDDIVRYTLRRLVEKCCTVIAEAENGQAAVELVEEHQPDIVLLDISMPFMNGFEAARCIRNQQPEVRIIFVSSHSEAAYVDRAFEVGALGYVFKSSAVVQLPHAIENVTQGRMFRPT